jgi:group I intron endonuclease
MIYGKMGYIYIVTNNLTGKQYVGQTLQKDIETRWNQHRKLRKTMLGRYILSAYQKYGIDNFNFKIICICFDQACNDLEEMYIKKFNTLSPNGYNLKTGGRNSKHSQESKDLISQNRKGKGLNYMTDKLRKSRVGKFSGDKNPNYGKPISDEQKLKISNGMKEVWKKKKEDGFTLTVKQLEALEKGAKRPRNKKDQSEKLPTKGRKQRVAKMDEYGTILEEFVSVTDAANKTGACRDTIASVCRGIKKHAGGFKWKYLDVEGEVKRNNSTGELYITKYSNGYMFRINNKKYKSQKWFKSLEEAIIERNKYLK